MPIRLNLTAESQAAPPPRTGGGIRLNLDPTFDGSSGETSAPNEGGTFNDLAGPAGILGAAGLLAAGVASRKPGLLAKGARKALDLRQQLMLSGMAIPKAVVGNIGGAAIESAERRTLAPLRQLLSKQTLKDVVAEYRAGAPGHVRAVGTPTGKAAHGPGRVLGALDQASQKAFARAGLTAEEAERVTFQTPLGRNFGKEVGEALDSPAARYLLPFRRTPFNVALEGAKTLRPSELQDPAKRALMATAIGAGGVHGAATADDQFPMSLGVGAAGANRLALPYLLAASGGRALAGGRNAEAVMGEALPVSEYGLASGITHPLTPYTSPALLRVLNRLLGER